MVYNPKLLTPDMISNNNIFANTKMKTLELFSGTGSVNRVCKKYGEVVSVDITDKLGHTPTHLVDILQWDYKQYPPGYFDFIWASPPCASFSCMLYISKSKTEIQKLMETIGLPLLNRAREIIDYFKPKYYCIENPDSGRMKNYITDLPYKRASYCQYGYDYRKHTRFWTNIDRWSPKLCNCTGRHKTSVGGTRKHPSTKNPEHNKYITTGNSSYNIAQKYSIPQPLIIDMVKSFTAMV